MKLSSDDRRKKRVFDVDALQKNHSLYGKNVLNLKPKFRTRHPWIWTAAVLIVLVAIFFGARQLSTRAEVQDFYPSSCLGNWQNSGNAQGEPETLVSASTSFSADNSAMYASGTQIFCGGFLPSNFATSGVITNVGLTLVWQIGTSTLIAIPNSEVTSTDTTVLSSSTDITAPTSTPTSTLVEVTSTEATSTDTTSTQSITPTSPTDTSTDISTDTTTDSSTDDAFVSSTDVSATGTSLLREIIPFAFADTTDADSSSTSAASSTSSTVILGPPLTADLAPPASTSSSPSSGETPVAPTSSLGVISSTTAIAAPPPIPDQNFLDVSYSTDGQTWISIGQVNINNWQQFTVTLPISDWNDLQNLQIRIEGIPTTQDPIPPIYLDGMFAEVDYEVPPAITLPGNPDQGSSSTQQVIQVNPNVTITLPPPTTAPTVPAPSITAITQTSDQVSVTVQYVGDFYDGIPLYMFVYPQGTVADRNDAGSAFTFAGEPQEGPSINALPIDQSMFDPTTDQATVVIVTPSPQNDSQIATAAMGSSTSTYDVDISYFDGQTWHLVPAQTFIWP